MSAPYSVPTTTSVALAPAGHARARARAAALAVMALGMLLIAAAAAVLATFFFAARRERAEHSRWLEGEVRIAAHQTGRFVPVPDADSPTGTRPEWRVLPQVKLEYELDGVATTTWVDIPTSGLVNTDGEAQYALGHYPVGDTILVHLDPDDVTVLKLAINDDGRRTAIIGCVLGFFLMMPGVGLIFVGWLWRRFGG